MKRHYGPWVSFLSFNGSKFKNDIYRSWYFFYLDMIFLLDIFEKIHWNNDVRKRKIKKNKYKTEEKNELINRKMEAVKKV